MVAGPSTLLLFSSSVGSLFSVAFAQGASSNFTADDLKSALSSNGVANDVFTGVSLDSISVPLLVTYGSTSVTPGANMTSDQTGTPPTFSVPTGNSSLSTDNTYLIAMVDPDAPTPQNRSVSQIMHFVGPDFTLNSNGTFTNKSAALAEYRAPSPPAGSAPHRYTIALFMSKGSGSIKAPSGFNASNRSLFNLSKFTSDVGSLSLVSANFFYQGPPNSTDSGNTTGGSTSAPSSALASEVNVWASLIVAAALVCGVFGADGW